MSEYSNNSRTLTYTEYLHNQWFLGVLYALQLVPPTVILYGKWQNGTVVDIITILMVGIIVLSFFQLDTLTPQHYEKLVRNKDPWVHVITQGTTLGNNRS